MVSRRTERDYQDAGWTPGGQGRLFFEPAAGPQQQKQDINNKREQSFKALLKDKIELPSTSYGFPHSVGEQIVNSSFASRDEIINSRADQPGAVPSIYETTTEGEPRNDFGGDTRVFSEDQGDWASAQVERPFDREIDSTQFKFEGLELPGSILRMPQRSINRDLTDTARATMPGERRGRSFLTSIEEVDHRGGQMGSPTRVGGRPLGKRRPRTPINTAYMRDSIMEGQVPSKRPGGMEPAGEWLKETKDDLVGRVDEAARSVVSSRMARDLARNTEVDPNDLGGLRRLRLMNRESRVSEDAPGYYEPTKHSITMNRPDNTPTLVHEIGHHVSVGDVNWGDRNAVSTPVSRDLRQPTKTTNQRPREEAYADDYRATHLPSHEGTGYRYSDAYFSSPSFAAEYDAARKVPDRGDSDRRGRLGLLHAELKVRDTDDRLPVKRRAQTVIEQTRQRLGPEPKKPVQPTLFDKRTNEIYPERI